MRAPFGAYMKYIWCRLTTAKAELKKGKGLVFPCGKGFHSGQLLFVCRVF